MTDITPLLSALGQGDPHAASRLLPLVYGVQEKLRLEGDGRAAAQAEPAARRHGRGTVAPLVHGLPSPL